jgi:uncharacterized phiE125 gp8 family phage protein
MLKLITAPTAEPLTLAEVKAHCAIDSDDFDTILTGCVAGVRAHLEKTLGRALVTQTWELRLPNFPAFGDAIELPRPPLQSVTSVSYVDTFGETATLATAAYQVYGVGGDQPGAIAPAYGLSWPEVRRLPEAVTIRFTAGYPGDGASPEDLAANVPPDIKAAMLAMVADLFANRESVSADQTYSIPIPATAKSLLAPFKVWSLP